MQSTAALPAHGPSNARTAMHHRPRLKLLASCLGVALAQWGGAALADSAVGVDTALGNALNPPGRPALPRAVEPDSDATIRRSPSGQLYGLPPALSNDVNRTEGGWEYQGSLEVGGLGGEANTQSTQYRAYKDLQNGLLLNYFDLDAQAPDTAHYVQALGGGVGQRDQFYGLQTGRYNDWKLKFFYTETPHVFSSNFKPIYSDNGSNHLVLNNGTAGGNGATPFTPPATALGALNTYAKTLPDTEVSLIRRKGGARYDKTITDNWKTFISFTQEKREGDRPFSLMAVEGLEPIHYTTNDLVAGVQYADKLSTLNLKFSASLFTNDMQTLYARWPSVAAQNPATGTLAASDTLVYSLPPDNQAYNLKAEYALKLPDFYKGRVSASVALGSSQQDAAIRMPIDPGLYPNSAVIAGTSPLNTAAYWNGTNGLPLTRSTSGQRIDSTLLNLSLSLNPVEELALKAGVRYYETDNQSGTYYAYNPQNGNWFNGLFNSVNAFGVATPSTTGVAGAGRCQPAPGFPVVAGCTSAATSSFTGYDLMAVPRDNNQTNYTLSGDYAFSSTSSLEASYEREDFAHSYREREKTWENKFKLSYVNRSLGDMTLRTSLESDSKRGSFYDPVAITRDIGGWFTVYGVPYNRAALQNLITKAGTTSGGFTYPTLATVQAALLATQHNSGGWMRPDQADRDQNILNARLNYAAREDLDVSALLQLKAVNYPGNSMGPQSEDSSTFNLDINYQPASGTRLSAFYARQDSKGRQINNYGNVPAGQPYGATLASYAAYQCTGSTTGQLTANNIDCFLNNARIPGSNVTEETKSMTDVLGFGLSREFGNMLFSANYSYSKGVTSITHAYGPTALTTANAATEALYGDYPNMETTQNALDLNLLVPLAKKTSMRLMYRYEDNTINDWHYNVLTLPNLASPLAAADYGAQSYSTRIFGLFLQHGF